MTPEERMTEILHSTAADPGPNDEQWDEFIGRSYRARRKHRVVTSAATLAVVLSTAIGGVILMDTTTERSRPEPAHTSQEDRTEKIDELEEEVRETERRIRETERISAGPGRRDGLAPITADSDREKRSGRVRGNTTKPPVAPPDRAPRAGSCGGRPGTVSGTDGDDRLRGTDAADVFVGFEGDDVVIGLGGDDYICGGPGNDSLSGGAGDDLLFAADGDDFIGGDSGHDHVWYSEASQAMTVNLDEGTARGEGTDTLSSIESVVATNFSDTLIGNSSANGIFARGGADVISGGAGDDWLHPEGGDDTVRGDDGIDMVAFAFSPNSVRIDLSANRAVGDGVDTLSGVEAASGSHYDDVFTGDDQNNTFEGGVGSDTASGGAGDDHLSGHGGEDKLDGGVGNDTLIGGDGTDICSNGEQEQSCEASDQVATTTLLMLALGAAVSARSRKEERVGGGFSPSELGPDEGCR